MRNFSIIAKGKYLHEQTSKLLEVTRYLIVRKKKGRVLLLDLRNCSQEKLTAMQLKIEQFDARGNSLGETVVKLDSLAIEKGDFVLKKEISVHRACIDFRAEVTAVEYGNYVYRLGGEDTFVTYEKPVVRKSVDKKKMRKKLGNRNFLAKRRKLAIPLFVSVFVGVLLCVSPAFAFLQSYYFDNNGEKEFHLKNVQYEFTETNYNDKTPVNVVGYDGIGGQNIVIPATLDGHPVKAVKAEAFKQNLFIETLTVASGVIIEDRAFAECPFLKEVVLQGTATVGAEAFYNCDSLVSVKGENVLSIGDKAFFDCSALKSVRIESKKDDGTITIGKRAFGRCGSFDEIYVKRFIKYGEDSDFFYSDFKVDTLYLQNYNYAPYETVTTSAKPLNALFGGMDCEIKNLHIGYTDGIPADFVKGCEENLQSLKIGAMDSKAIGDRAFYKCRQLSSVSFPIAITSVGESAFEKSGITSFDTSTLTDIGMNAFAECKQLKQVKFSDSLKNIPIGAFQGCEKLNALTISKGVQSIGTGAFKDCTGVESIAFDKNSKVTVIMPEAFAGIRKVRRVDLPQKLEKIGEKAFADCRSLRYLTIPQSVAEMDKTSFENCYKLYEIENYSSEYLYLGSGVSKYAFKVYTSENDERLQRVKQNGFELAQRKDEWFVIDYTGKGGSVTMPTPTSVDSYKVVDYLFGENTNVKKVSVPACVTDMGNYAFLDSQVESVSFEERSGGVAIREQTFAGATSLKTVDMSGCLQGSFASTMKLPEKAFAGCTNLTTVKLFRSINTISAGAFLDCKNLKTVSGCQSVWTIGESAFKNCEKLQSVDLTANLWKIEDRAFYGCENFDFNDSQVLNGVSRVGEEAFKYCEKLSYAFFNGSLEYLGESAFEGCASLQSANVFGSLQEIKDHTFSGCMQLRYVNFDSGIKAVGEKAFYNCIRLENVYLPSSLMSIGDSAFRNNKALKSVNFDSVELVSVGEKAFYKNQALERVEGLRGTIGASAFEGCEALTSVYINQTNDYQVEAKIGQRAFYGCKKLEAVHIPYGVTAIEDDAFECCPSLHEVANESDLYIERDSVENGKIGYNALLISDRYYFLLEKEFLGNFLFKQYYDYGEKRFLVDYTGNAKHIELGGQVLMDGGNVYYPYEYEIARYAFEEHDSIERISIGDYVTAIRTEAFCGLKHLKEIRLTNENGLVLQTNTFSDCRNIERLVIGKNFEEICSFAICERYVDVYYMGSISDWYSHSGKYLVNVNNVRFYENTYGVHECVHQHNAGEAWDYDEKQNITTKIRPYIITVAEEATCTREGLREFTCDRCSYYRKETISPHGHNFVDNQCTYCEYINGMPLTPNTEEKLNRIAEISWAGSVPFVYSDTLGYETSSEMQVGDGAELTIVARTRIYINLSCVNTSTTGELRVITQSSTTVVGSATKTLNFWLYAGETLTIQYKKVSELAEGEEWRENLEYARIKRITFTQENP